MRAAAMPKEDDVIQIVTERFERRIAEECAKIRVETANGFADIRREMSTMRVEIIKWSFAFWLAQIATIGMLFLRTS